MDALENLASIDAHLTIGVRYVGTVDHETATLDILSSNIHRRNRTARSRRNEVLQAAEKDRISINQQRLNATPNKALECHVNVALAVSVSDNEFKPQCTRRGMQLRHNSLDVGTPLCSGAFRNRRVCHQRGTLVYGERTTPNSARRKQVNRPSRAHTKKWRSIGCYSPD